VEYHLTAVQTVDELKKILHITPQWLMITRSEWTFLPWALFNCFGALESETNPTLSSLSTLLNEDPKILILTSNPKKYYTNNAVDLSIESFHGKSSETILQKMQLENKWTTPSEIMVSRLRPMYGSLTEFIDHYRNLLANYAPSHVILDDKISIDNEFSQLEPKIYSEAEIKNFYEQIKDVNSLHGLQKFISHAHFLFIPSEQMAKDSFLVHYKLKSMSDIQCSLEVKAHRDTRVDLEVEYTTNHGFMNSNRIGKFKVYCYHTGLLKLT
jgi:hypothetical protein